MKTAPSIVGLALALLAAAGMPAVAASPSDEYKDPPQHVVLICLDTVRADRLGCYGYTEHDTTPALDALAARSTLFADTSACASWTKPSVPSFFTGVYPVQHGVYEGNARRRVGHVTDVLGVQVVTLAEAFKAQGFRTAAFIHNAQLREGSGFGQGFDVYADRAGDAASIVRQAMDWMDANADRGRMFVYLHMLDAHWPYDVPDAYANRFAQGLDTNWVRNDDWRAVRDELNTGKSELTVDQHRSLEALYAGAIRYIDDELGWFFDQLDQRGLSQRTVLSVLADHGEEFLEHGRVGHGHGLYENLLRVGWILHVPDVEPSVVPTAVSLVDLYPTLLGSVGLTSPVHTEGIERLAHPGRRRPIYAEHKSTATGEYFQSLRVGAAKLVRRFRAPLTRRLPVGLLSCGTRWEAEVELLPDGRLRATQLKPRDEDPAELLEIKGAVSHFDQGRFALIGIPVRLHEKVQLYGSPLPEGGLVDGLVVKAQGGFSDDVFLALQVKCYPPAPSFDAEIRGTVKVVEADRVRIGPLWVYFDDQTEWKDVENGGMVRRISREQIVHILQNGAAAAEQAGFEVEFRLYDLEADPGELDPVEVVRRTSEASHPDLVRLNQVLDEESQRLVQLRLWHGGEEATLSVQALEELRAIGYVR